MSNSEMTRYLDLLSEELAEMYNLSKEHSDELVARSPMIKLLQEDAEYVAHMPLCGWAEKIYRTQM